MSRFLKLKNRQIHISELTRDDDVTMMKERQCAYCGSKDGLSIDHIIPLIKEGSDASNNKVLCCKICNSSKLDHAIFEWYYLIRKRQDIPSRAVNIALETQRESLVKD